MPPFSPHNACLNPLYSRRRIYAPSTPRICQHLRNILEMTATRRTVQPGQTLLDTTCLSTSRMKEPHTRPCSHSASSPLQGPSPNWYSLHDQHSKEFKRAASLHHHSLHRTTTPSRHHRETTLPSGHHYYLYSQRTSPASSVSDLLKSSSRIEHAFNSA